MAYEQVISKRGLSARGLSTLEARESAVKYGRNTLTKIKRKSFLRSLIGNFGDPMIRVLLIALSINAVFLFGRSNWYESLGIAAAVLVAVIVSTVSEYSGESAFEKLQEASKNVNCRLLRDGKTTVLPIGEIVVGDVVLLSSGDKIPADGVIISGSLEVDQSALNGESKEAHKLAGQDVKNQKQEGGGDFLNPRLLFSGTVVNGGEGTMAVAAVGDNTFYGKLAKEIQEETPDSPLKIKLQKLAKKISLFGYIGAFLVGFSYLFNALIIKNSFNGALILKSFEDYHALITHVLNAATLAVTVIVLAVPEGLPMMITVVLSANMRRMLKDNVLIRRLNGIETAGSMNILFTDKTGTLTNGKLDVVNIVTGGGRIQTVDEFIKNRSAVNGLLKLSLQYNTGAQLVDGKAVGGNATDRVLTEFAQTIAEKDVKGITKSKTIPFDSKNKFMATTINGYRLGGGSSNGGLSTNSNGNSSVNAGGSSSGFTLIKGAPEKILEGCTHYYAPDGTVSQLSSQAALIKAISDLSYKAMRIIAVATSNAPVENPEQKFGGLTLVALIGIRDQIRKEAVRGVDEVSKAGIQTVMITGDSKATAMAVARETGIIFSQSDLVLTSDELNKLSDDELRVKLKDLRVVARALPNDKSRLVRIAQSLNLVTGMTGDGVNDAPALKKADIGFAMGSGTEVAKEAADAVIMDDNILSISRAVCYGRTVFKSIRKFIVFQLTINFCAMAISVIAPFLNIETPITVIQMLWINLVMDTLAGIAFGGERPRLKYMAEPPKTRGEPIINKYMWQQILLMTLYMSAISIAFLKSGFVSKAFSGKNSNYYMTAFFALFMFLAIFNSFNARTHEINLIDYLALNKPFIWIIGGTAAMQILLTYVGGALFRTTPLTVPHLLIILVVAFSVIPLDLLRKFVTRKFGLFSGT